LFADVLVMSGFIWESSGVYPSKIPGLDVVPSFFDFVVAGPEELTLKVFVVRVEDAAGHLFNLRVVVEFGVAPAHALVDGPVVDDALLDGWVFVVAVWSEDCGGSVNIYTSLFIGEVWLWALNFLALILVGGGSIVESVQPMGAVIGGKSPLSEPDVVLDVFSLESLVEV